MSVVSILLLLLFPLCLPVPVDPDHFRISKEFILLQELLLYYYNTGIVGLLLYLICTCTLLGMCIEPGYTLY